MGGLVVVGCLVGREEVGWSVGCAVGSEVVGCVVGGNVSRAVGSRVEAITGGTLAAATHLPRAMTMLGP